MAHIQIQMPDDLKEKAQAVASELGMDLSAAIMVFLAQMVQEKGLPFIPCNDPFYSAPNQEALRASLAELKEGKTVTRSLSELRGME